MFRFSLSIPGVDIHTEAMRHDDCRLVYNYIRWFIRVWKWHWELDWGLSRLEQEMRKAKKSQPKQS